LIALAAAQSSVSNQTRSPIRNPTISDLSAQLMDHSKSFNDLPVQRDQRLFAQCIQ
jgi:hypothetical protein